MKNIELLVKKVLKEEFSTGMVLNENIQISENLEYHIKNKISLSENVFRPYSDGYFNLVCEVRDLYETGMLDIDKKDRWILETDLGKMVRLSNGEIVSLDCPYLMTEEELLSEAEYQGKKVKLNYPTRNTGGGKKYKVYVMNPSTKRVKKITFGDVHGGLTAKVSNPEARRNFASRHNCKSKKDKMKAGYWACALPRFGHLFGGKSTNSYW